MKVFPLVLKTSKSDPFIAYVISFYQLMPKSKRGESSGGIDKQLSTRTKKQIDSLPEHAQHIYKNEEVI